MSRVINYKDLFVWQKSMDLAKNIYLIFPKVKNEKLVELLAKSSIGISSNIAEGNSRQISKEYRQFLYCALGDISQVDCQLFLAKEMGFITQEEYSNFEEKVIELRKMLYGLISKLRQRALRPPGMPPYGSTSPNVNNVEPEDSEDTEDAEDTATAEV